MSMPAANHCTARHPGFLLALLVMLVASSGASCPGFIHNYPSALPRVLPTTPTLADVQAVVNGNSSRIQSMYTTDAEIYIPGAPTTWANIALERPRRFRLRAETRLTGPEVDLGSNDELFWCWVRRSQQPAIYYCRHEQFALSAARQVLPVEPEWLIDAMGVPTIDPAGEHSNPIPVGQGRIRVESRLPRPGGDLRRAMVIDDARGWVLEQHIYDAAGQPLASAILSGHRLDPLANAVLPRTVKIIAPASRLEMTITLKDVQVNQLPGDPRVLWSMPSYPNFTPVDLADPNLRLAPTQSSPLAAPEPPPPQRTSWLNKWKLY